MTKKKKSPMKQERFLLIDGNPVNTSKACQMLGSLVFYETMMDRFGVLTETDEQRQKTFDDLYEAARRRYFETRDRQNAMPQY